MVKFLILIVIACIVFAFIQIINGNYASASGFMAIGFVCATASMRMSHHEDENAH